MEDAVRSRWNGGDCLHNCDNERQTMTNAHCGGQNPSTDMTTQLRMSSVISVSGDDTATDQLVGAW